ncbi:amidase [Sphingomonas crocodyli]|uniref:Amidase n=1 Tax=Sphingomonas crocodyli TaxID=1979270 RepID=A0A437LWI3_9SPHN|nr:amidase [Sphingomonas crocodyli]
MVADEFLDLSAHEQVTALAAGKVGAVELMQAAIARIEARDGVVNAVVVRDFDRALAAAREADAAIARGDRRPLLGLPMTVKESHNVAGLPTTWGFEPFRDAIADTDSLGVERLRSAGAIILGKTNVPTWLADWQSVNPIYGRTTNPYDSGRSPGGSSGGSAAVLAARMVALEFGSDIGGSIRVPAAFCGVYGHKPSWQLIPGRGHVPPAGEPGAFPHLSVVGPMARTARDLEIALDVLAGPDSDMAAGYQLALREPRGERLSDYRVLVVDRIGDLPIDGEVTGALSDLVDRLAKAGVTIIRDASILPDLVAARAAYGTMVTTITSARSGQPAQIDAHGWIEILNHQARFQRAFAAAFRQVDIVLSPVFGTAAFPHNDAEPMKRVLTIDGQDSPYFNQIGWIAPATFGHLPATSAPIAQTAGGLPIGVQIIGPSLEDRTPIRFARLIEEAFGGYRPPVGF